MVLKTRFNQERTQEPYLTDCNPMFENNVFKSQMRCERARRLRNSFKNSWKHELRVNNFRERKNENRHLCTFQAG